MRVLTRSAVLRSSYSSRWLARLGATVIPLLLATTAVSHSAGATPAPTEPRIDQAFILEVSAGSTRVAYSGECDVMDSMGAKRRKPIQGYTADRLRFVGVEVSCRLRGDNGVSLTATLSHSPGVVVAMAQGGALSIAAQ